MLFSILVPVYNASEYISQCIESVLEQSYTNYEIILVDDGSTDSSGDICDKYAEQDSRIKVFHRNNHGLLLTRRFGIEKISGDYVLFLDSDDWLEPNMLEKLNGILEKNDVDLIIYRYQTVDGMIKKSSPVIFDNYKLFNSVNKKELYDSLVKEQLSTLWSKCVKSSVIDHDDYKEYRNITLGEDMLQTIPLFDNAETVLSINDILYNYRLNNSSMTHTAMTKGKIDSYIKVREFLYNYLINCKYADKSTIEYMHQSALNKLLDIISNIITSNSSTEMKELCNYIRSNEFAKFILSCKKWYKALNNKKKIIYMMFKIHGEKIIHYCYHVINNSK